MTRPKISKQKTETKETGLAKRDPLLDAIRQVERLTAEAHELAEGAGQGTDEVGEQETASQALVPVGDRALAAPALKSKLAKTRALTLKKQQEMQKAAANLEALMASKVQALEAAMRPLKKMVEQATEMIWTVNLYLGRDEEIVMLREGKPAPANTVLSIRQQVLAADEESMVLAEEGGIDASNLEEFDEWLLADEAHLQQLLPEAKGVVVLIPRRQHRDYGSPWEDAAMDKANKQSYWLIKNGERVYRMATDFTVGDTLVPKREEFTQFFSERHFNFETREYETTQLRPGSYQWIEAEERSDARQRHFMRVALILQGLVDRTPVFHPLPEGGLNLLSAEAYEAGKVRVITDAEMLLTEGRELFKDWLKRLNGELRVGMRITGNFEGVAFRNANERERGYKHSRLSPGTASHPESAKLYQIEERGARGTMKFRYARTDKVWDARQWESRGPKMRASCTVYAEDTFILPFDLVSVAEMEYYLGSRLDRPSYIAMVPLLKSTILAKKQEEEAEEPFRKLIVGQLMAQSHFDYEEAVAQVAMLVNWWKLSNRWHRPLVNEPETEAKALKMIVAEGTARKKAQQLGSESDSLAQGRLEAVEGMLAIYQKRDGTYLGLAEQDNPYVRHYTLPKTGQGIVNMVAEWQLPSPGLKKWRKVWESAKWKTWPTNVSAADFLSGPEKEAALETILAQVKADAREKRNVMAVTYKAKERLFEVWLAPERQTIDERHLLTRKLPDLHLTYLEAHWKRGKGGVVSAHAQMTWSHNYYWHEDEWKREGRAMLFEDSHAIERAHAWKATHELAGDKRNKLFDKMHRLEKSVELGWEKIEEAKEHARFMEDYQDEDLWEGHKKSLKQKRMPNDDALRRLTEILIEAGIEVSDLSVAEAREKALALTGGKTTKVKDKDGFTDEVKVPSAEQLAEILVLRYGELEAEEDE